MAIQVKNEQDEKITEISSKLSTYEDRLYKMSKKERHIQPLVLQVKNELDEKITELSSRISTYEDRIEKMSIIKTQIQPMSLQITESSSKSSAYVTPLKK